VIDQWKVEEPLEALGIGQVQSIMFWPGDTKRQNEFMAAAYKSVLIEKESSKSTEGAYPVTQAYLDAWRRDLGGWAAILESPNIADVEKRTRERRNQTHLVGSLFLFVYALSLEPVGKAGRASLRKAIRLLQPPKGSGEKKIAQGSAMGAWKRFRSVAHFWGAYNLVEAWQASGREWTSFSPREAGPQEPWGFNPEEVDKWRRILLIAAYFRKFGLEFIPDNTKKTLLDPADTVLIRVPDDWKLTVPTPRIPPHLLKRLRSA